MISYYLLLVNIIAFILYGIDKFLAIKKKYRIPESNLIFISFIGGALGSIFGMYIFHHKTKKNKFKILIPLSVILWILIFYKLK